MKIFRNLAVKTTDSESHFRPDSPDDETFSGLSVGGGAESAEVRLLETIQPMSKEQAQAWHFSFFVPPEFGGTMEACEPAA